MITLRTAIGLCAALALGCSAAPPAAIDAGAPFDAPPDAPADAPLDGGAGGPLDAFLDALADAVCAQAARCDGHYRFDGTLVTAPAHAACSSREREAARALLASIGAHVELDAAIAGTCPAAIAAETDCFDARGSYLAPLTHPRSPCAGAIRGTLAEHAACTTSLECGGGLYCRPADDGCAGTCEQRGVIGAPCDDRQGLFGAHPCAEGASCNGTTCEASRCDCAPDETCDASLACAAQPQRGEPCAFSGLSDCDDGLECLGSGGMGFGACGDGEPLDASCGIDVYCGPGLRCVEVASGSRCMRALAPGHPCTSHLECPAGLECRDARCVEPIAGPALGEACTTTCSRGACRSGTCTLLPVGSLCDVMRDECEGVCDRGACVTPAMLGDACEPVCPPDALCRLDPAGDRCQARCTRPWLLR